jgi:hypothetical protein
VVRRATLLWWSGLFFIAIFGLIVAGAAMFFLTGCEVDCGDSGGRGMFVLVVASTPLVAAGAVLAWIAPRTGTPWGAARTLRRPLYGLLSLGLVVVAGGLGLLAVTAFVEAFHQFEGWLTGRGLSGPLNYPEYMRDQARDEGLFMSFLGLVCVGLAVIAIAPVVAMLSARQLPSLLRSALLSLGWVALGAAVLGVAGAVVTLAQSADSLEPAEMVATLAYPALPAALAAGAFLVAREIRRRD